MMNLIVFGIVLALSVVGVCVYIVFLKKELIALGLKAKESLEKEEALLDEWKGKLVKGEVPTEEAIKALALEVKELQKQVFSKIRELAGRPDIEKDPILKVLRDNLKSKESDLEAKKKIFKAKRVSTLDIEILQSELDKRGMQIVALSKSRNLWVGWLVASAIISLSLSALVLLIPKVGGVISLWSLWIVFLGLQIYALVKAYKVVPENHEYVITFFGKKFCVWDAGLHFLFPFWMKVDSRVFMGDMGLELLFDSVVRNGKISAKVDFQDASAEVVVTVFFRIFSAMRAVFQVGNVRAFIAEKMEAGIRAYYGRMALDEAIESRADVDLRQIVIQDATEAGMFKSWGVMITSLAVTDIRIPEGVEKVRQKKLEAEKDREVTEIAEKTQEINVRISKLKGAGEGERLLEQARLLKMTPEQMVEFEKFLRHQDALGKAGVLIANAGSGSGGDAATAGAVAGAVATAVGNAGKKDAPATLTGEPPATADKSTKKGPKKS